MRKYILTTILFLLITSCKGQNKLKNENRESEVKLSESKIDSTIITGAERYPVYLPILKNKKVGIVTNQTGGIHKKGE